MAHHVFISYSAKDKPTASAVCAGLEGAGIRCWITPRDVPPGREFGAAIIQAISESRLMVVVFSASANSSQHVIREVTKAVSSGITIIPFRVENVEPTGQMEYCLNIPHWLDAFTPPLEARIGELVAAVQRLMGSTFANVRAETNLDKRRGTWKPIGRPKRTLRLVLYLLGPIFFLSMVSVALKLNWDGARIFPSHTPASAPRAGLTVPIGKSKVRFYDVPTDAGGDKIISIVSKPQQKPAISVYIESANGDPTWVAKSNNIYLPLHKGNRWIYQRTLYRRPWHFFGFDSEEFPGARACYNTLVQEQPRTSYELYQVESPGHSNQFEISIATSENAMPRDGRYSSRILVRPLKVTWLFGCNGGMELFLYYLFPTAANHHPTGTGIACRPLCVFPPLRYMDHYYWGIGALDVASEVTVPAGTFRDVIKNVTAFNAEDFTTTILARSKVLFREPGDLNEPAFVTESYYAKDVGLIKELQYGRDGQATYEMVLLSYELH